MSAIRGTYRNGRVELTDPPPAEWKDGQEVRVELVAADDQIGMREEDWPTTPEGIEALIARMDQMQPFLSPEDEERWLQSLEEDKRRERERGRAKGLAERIREAFP